MLYIGSHVSMSGKKMLLGSVEETIKNGANAMMIYTGAPQNTKRKPIEELRIDEAKELMAENNIDIENVIIHAPYIINLANSEKPATFEIAVDFLKLEIERTEAIGAKYIVLHPGAHIGAGVDRGIQQIITGLDMVLTEDQEAIICLETMSGKGSEVGKTFEELAYIINNVKHPEKMAVCLDTCHIHDAGYDVNDFDKVLDEFDQVIGLERLKVLHINDSKNPIGASKDRHDNLGYGYIGFETLINIIHNPRLDGIVKVLETPYADGRKTSPYAKEIAMIKQKEFTDWLDDERNTKN